MAHLSAGKVNFSMLRELARKVQFYTVKINFVNSFVIVTGYCFSFREVQWNKGILVCAIPFKKCT